jgi:pimeloyl-ACP methyl ester carboxylesterase
MALPPHPPEATFGDMDLPNTRLHYVKSGTGPPLIIVPATVSLIRQWLPLTQFMVPKTVEAFVDNLGYDKFHLMGFSFGGLLALRTLEHLQDRVEKVILLSPCVSRRALKWSTPRQWAFKASIKALKNQTLLHGIHYVMNAPRLEKPLTYALSKVSNVDRRILRNKNALRLPISTLDVFAYTLDEIFRTEYQYSHAPFNVPCYFGMSINDDILDYALTEQVVKSHFQQPTIQKFTHPYHQPPEPPTFEWLNREFGQFLEMIE